MKVTLYMAMTANGYIAKEDDSTDFVSDGEWESFCAMATKVGAIIIGRRTYEIMLANNDFDSLKNVKVVVCTQNVNFKPQSPTHIIASSPKNALSVLEKEGHTSALVTGGATINALFMKENLVDELYFDIEPVVFGSGIPLFAKADFERKLQLIETKKLSVDELQLHYKVMKNETAVH